MVVRGPTILVCSHSRRKSVWLECTSPHLRFPNDHDPSFPAFLVGKAWIQREYRQQPTPGGVIVVLAQKCLETMLQCPGGRRKALHASGGKLLQSTDMSGAWRSLGDEATFNKA